MISGLKIAVIGGDKRHVYLAEGLRQAGMDASLHCCGGQQSDIERLRLCHVLVLPAPATDGQGRVRTPLWEGELTVGELVEAARPGALLLAGLPGEDLTGAAQQAGLVVDDYFSREELTVSNALITAEGALLLALSRREETLWGSRVLLTGMGRIAKVLLRQLVALGARVTVAARRPEDRQWARIGGAEAVDFAQLPDLVGDFDLVLNTVPHKVVDAGLLGALRPGCLVIDLTSRPGGVDMEAAEALGVEVEWALGLPGKTAPRSAAGAVQQTLLALLALRGML